MAVAFECVTFIDAPVEVVFDLSLSIDAHLASMEASGERAVAGVTTGQIGLGEEVTWTARHFGLRWTMTSRVTELDRPYRFVDEQIRGPFARFRHEHCFVECAGQTEMTDLVTFAAPLGPLGLMAEAGGLRWYLPRLIAGRSRFLKAEAEEGSSGCGFDDEVVDGDVEGFGEADEGCSKAAFRPRWLSRQLSR